MKPKSTATAFDGSSRVLRFVSDSALILISPEYMFAYYTRWFEIRVSRTEMSVLCSWKTFEIVRRKYLVLLTADLTVIQISKLSGDDFINNETHFFLSINNSNETTIKNQLEFNSYSSFIYKSIIFIRVVIIVLIHRRLSWWMINWEKISSWFSPWSNTIFWLKMFGWFYSIFSLRGSATINIFIFWV